MRSSVCLMLLSIPAACGGTVVKTAALTAAPLPERAAVDGPRFTKLDAAKTGLDFTNVLRPENIVAYVYMGAGVAVGDYDNDGLPDVYLVSQDGPNKLFRQVAPMQFVDVTAAAGGLDGGDAWGTAATFADVDGDGDLDLYVCNLESPNLLYLNRGDGTFEEAGARFGLDLVAASTGAAFADYDNDGDLDLYVLTNRVLRPTLTPELVAEMTLPKDLRKTRQQLMPPFPPEQMADNVFEQDGHKFLAGQCDHLFRNEGNKRFVDVTAEAGIHDQGNGLSVVWWDYDGDGYQDIYVADDFQSPDHLYHNLGNGKFADVTAAMLPHTAFFGMGADFGDIDNDGRLDFCVADMSGTTHYMSKMLMGSMDQHRWFLMHANPQQYMRNAVYLNSGTDRFLEAANLTGLASTDWTWSVRFADLDEDGRLDFFATNGIPKFTDNPDLIERVKQLWKDGQRAQALDLLRHVPRVDEPNIARRNDGDLHFTDVGAEWGLDDKGVTHGAVICDLDRDGDLDIVTNNLNAPAGVFENRTADTHRLLVRLIGAKNRFGVGARLSLEAGGLRQERLVSLTRGYMSSGEAIEHFGLGKSERVDRLTVRWPGGAQQVFEGVAADQFLTIREDGEMPAATAPVVAKVATPGTTPYFRSVDAITARHHERDFDDFAVQPLLPARLSRLGPGIAVGDVDGDGRDDIWLGGAAGQAGTLSLARADGTFVAVDGPWRDDAECEDLGAVFVDFDGDGDLDLYVGSGGVEAGEKTGLLLDRLYVNDGKGHFTAAAAGVLPDLRISTSCVVAADFDHDGDVDLFVGGRVVPGRFPMAPTSVLLRNDGGRFVDVTAELLPQLKDVGMVADACWCDLDGDGFLDLVIAAQWQPLRVFGNLAGKGFRDRTKELGLDAIHGQWNGVRAADLDGDGDLDLVVTNLGLNTKYKASAQKPLRLFGKDIDGNGTFDVIEAKQSADTVLPVRGLSCSSQAMPFVRQEFPTYDAFARATLNDIYGGDKLTDSVALTCSELQHVVFENQGDHFVMHALPRLAQVSAGFGVAIADFDGDGQQDIVIAHNSWSPEPETGHNDGGLGVYLRGRGGMQFEAVPADRSGIVMPEDAKAMALVDLNGDGCPDVVCATNDGPVRTFVAGAKPSLGVRLHGAKGNPTAIGASIEWRGKDGGKQVRELSSGGGYLAQSSPTAWFAGVHEGDQLHVRWPDGHVTDRVVTATTGVVVIEP